MTSSETVADLASCFDNARAKVRALTEPGNAQNYALAAIGKAESRSVRSLFEAPKKP